MDIQGRYFDGQSSRPSPARLVAGDGLTLQIEGGATRPVALTELRISDRLGTLPRRLWFEDGASFETPDNDGIDRLLESRGRRGGLLHRLEARWTATLASVVVVAVLAWFTFTVGLPAFSDTVSRRLPDNLYTIVSEQTLHLLQEQLFDESRLPESRRQALHAEFQRMTESLDWGPGFKLHFHASGEMANAFALPDGSIVVTDALVELAESDEEVLAVLAHEAGHVIERHGMRRLVQSSMLVFIGIMVTGDTSGLGATALGLPTLLLELNYSREFEHESDAYAVQLLQSTGRDPLALARILERLEGAARPGGERHGESADETLRLENYLSTHPATEDRLREIRRLAGMAV